MRMRWERGGLGEVDEEDEACYEENNGKEAAQDLAGSPLRFFFMADLYPQVFLQEGAQVWKIGIEIPKEVKSLVIFIFKFQVRVTNLVVAVSFPPEVEYEINQRLNLGGKFEDAYVGANCISAESPNATEGTYVRILVVDPLYLFVEGSGRKSHGIFPELILKPRFFWSEERE